MAQARRGEEWDVQVVFFFLGGVQCEDVYRGTGEIHTPFCASFSKFKHGEKQKYARYQENGLNLNQYDMPSFNTVGVTTEFTDSQSCKTNTRRMCSRGVKYSWNSTCFLVYSLICVFHIVGGDCIDEFNSKRTVTEYLSKTTLDQMLLSIHPSIPLESGANLRWLHTRGGVMLSKLNSSIHETSMSSGLQNIILKQVKGFQRLIASLCIPILPDYLHFITKWGGGNHTSLTQTCWKIRFYIHIHNTVQKS